MVVHSESLKSRNTTLPRYALSEIGLPASSLRVKGGARRPESVVPGSRYGLLLRVLADDEPESWEAAAIAARTRTPPTVSSGAGRSSVRRARWRRAPGGRGACRARRRISARVDAVIAPAASRARRTRPATVSQPGPWVALG